MEMFRSPKTSKKQLQMLNSTYILPVIRSILLIQVRPLLLMKSQLLLPLTKRKRPMMNRSRIYLNATFFFSIVFYSIVPKCSGQASDTALLKISEYRVDPCISKLFVSVVKSNVQYYDSGKFFYSVTFKRAGKALYMNISAEKWTAAPYLDYGGILKLKQFSFLLRGDLDQGTIFKK